MVLMRLAHVFITAAFLLCPLAVSGQEKPQHLVGDSLLTRGIYEINTTPQKLQILFEKGNKSYNEGDRPLATESFSEYMHTLRGHLSSMFVLMSDYHKEAYLKEYVDQVSHIENYALAFSEQDAALGALAYDCELLSKGLLLESSNRLKFAVLNSGDEDHINWMNAVEELRQLYAQLRAYFDVLEADSAYLAALEVVRAGGSHKLLTLEWVESGYENMNKVAKAIIEFEENMSILTSLHKTPLPNLSVSWKDIQDVLSEGQASIEFTARKLSSDSPLIVYHAIVIRKELKAPIVVSLFLEDTLSKLLQSPNPDYDLLFDKIWRPIASHLEDIRDVYIAPSGLLAAVSFAALRYKGHYLIDYCNIHNVLSTRDIIKLKNEEWDNKSISNNALFFGGADFGVPPLVKDDNILDLSDAYRGQGFDYLPQSKKEAEISAGLLAEMGWKTTLFTDVAASKQNLIRFVSNESPSMLHIATHGFYFPKRDRTVSGLKMSEMGSAPQYVFSQDPLMRCGLLFSGANYTWNNKGPENENDNGILTGKELSGLNLSKTELAVISACHTAMGDINYAEGVHGIQRALRIAGAKKTIVALWAIPDKESAEFMQKFYTLLGVYRDVTSSFRHAQKIMQEEYASEPQKWAGFVLIE